VIGFVAQMGAGLLDPTLLLPGGVGVDAVRGGLSFQKAAVELGKAGLDADRGAGSAAARPPSKRRTFEESAINVASGTMLTALIGGSAAAYLGRAERDGDGSQAARRPRGDQRARGQPGDGRSTG
jgi:hypothetical protein